MSTWQLPGPLLSMRQHPAARVIMTQPGPANPPPMGPAPPSRPPTMSALSTKPSSGAHPSFSICPFGARDVTPVWWLCLTEWPAVLLLQIAQELGRELSTSIFISNAS